MPSTVSNRTYIYRKLSRNYRYFHYSTKKLIMVNRSWVSGQKKYQTLADYCTIFSVFRQPQHILSFYIRCFAKFSRIKTLSIYPEKLANRKFNEFTQIDCYNFPLLVRKEAFKLMISKVQCEWVWFREHSTNYHRLVLYVT